MQWPKYHDMLKLRHPQYIIDDIWQLYFRCQKWKLLTEILRTEVYKMFKMK